MLTPVNLIILFFVILLGSALTTRFLIHFLNHKKIFDVPNERSSHMQPVPRGGGIAILLWVLPLWLIYALHLPIAEAKPYFTMIGAALLLAVVSWTDDVKGLSAGVRLLAQILAVLIGLYTLGDIPPIYFFPAWLVQIMLFLFWVWFVNLFNFMDGIDGISAVEAATIAIGFSLMMFLVGHDITMAYPSLIILAAVLGFAVYNWHPAKVFMGDVGSIPLGFLLGWLLIKLILWGAIEAALIIPLYYLLDGKVTLLWRLKQGYKPWHAHRDHAYQKAAARGMKHSLISAKIMTFNCFLLLLAVMSFIWPFGVAFAIALTLTSPFWWYLRFGFPAKKLPVK